MMLDVTNCKVRSTAAKLFMYSPTLGWDAVEEASRVVQRYNAFVNRIEELGLSTAVDMQPILNVSHIQSDSIVYNVLKPDFGH